MCVFGSVIKCLVIPRPIPEAPPNCRISLGFCVFNDCVMAIMLLTGDNDASAGCHIVRNQSSDYSFRQSTGGPLPYADTQYPKSLEFPTYPSHPPHVGDAGGFPAGLTQDYAFTDVPMSYTPSPRIEGLSFLQMITNDPRSHFLL